MFLFGPHSIPKTQLFLINPLSVAFVNISPVVPGHVLVAPRRCAPRFADLHKEEIDDLFRTVQLVGSVVEKHFDGQGLTISIQDGPGAGQTVPHVHVHVMPRHPDDFKVNDDVYTALDESEANQEPGRKYRSPDEMAKEADVLRALF